jgi:hypothetical protein
MSKWFNYGDTVEVLPTGTGFTGEIGTVKVIRLNGMIRVRFPSNEEAWFASDELKHSQQKLDL